MKRIKELLKQEKVKKVLMIGIPALFLILILLFVVFKINTDGMNQSGIANVHYKTYGFWKKNGKTSGNKKKDITKVYIKTKRNDYVDFSVYSNGDWYRKSDNKTLDGIQGIKVALIGSYERKYDICYRTYNEKDKWLEWACDGEISGDREKSIKAIEVKIIPKGVIKKEYLKDFENTSNSTSVLF